MHSSNDTRVVCPLLDSVQQPIDWRFSVASNSLFASRNFSRITPALTEASKSVEVVKTEEDAMVAKRTSDD